MKHNVLAIAALTLATALTACNSNSKNQTLDGWVIKNEVKEIETIDLEEIAEAIEVIPIATDEPIDGIQGISGISNDFIACGGNRWQLFYHIKDGKLVDKLHAAGNGPNEYSQLLQYSYLPDENLFYGYDNRGQIMCFKTSPFKFETRFPLKTYAHSLFALGHNEMLMTALPPEDERKNVEKQQLGGSAVTVIKDSSVLYRFDGQNLTKLFCIAQGDDGPVFTRTSNGVLMSLMMPQHTLYRYANGQAEKVLTIDYGEMTMPEPEEKVEKQGDMFLINIIINGDYSTGCYHPQLYGSTLAYWHYTILNDRGRNCLAIATPESVRNYEVHIGGLNFEVNIDMVDNGVYTKIIQGDWESKINSNEELSPLGKRIIEAMKNNDENPVVLQFRLKDKYLNN
ncbi:MAG: 6-bladed beta-propeller [Salinivirgaceae bacterium]|nr:6-bladed beta-propeller [Salinivirgaceae bacterium]